MFESELQMQKKFIRLLKETKNSNQHILEEFNARFGNVDVIMSDLENLKISITDSQAEILSNYSTALIVASLHKKQAHTINYLIKKTGYTEETLCSTLSLLKKENIILEINNKYIISENFKFPNLKFKAYELKLKQWKKAILQAVRNQNFATQSYIVMPDIISSKLYKNQKNLLTEYNIGLIGITDDSLIYYINPKENSLNYYINPSLISSIAKYVLEIKNQA